jgi:heptosyltransferase-1
MESQQPPQRIVIIRPSALGDVCRTVPVLASLRRAWPDATIDWVVQEEYAAAIETHPFLNEVIRFPRARLAKWWRSAGGLKDALRWLGALRARKYDLVLDCQGLGRSGLMSFATRAPRRVGLRTARELAWLGYTVRAPRHPTAPMPGHTVDQMLLLIEELGVAIVRDMRLYVSEAHLRWWDHHRAELNVPSAPYAVIAPTSRWLSKRWPIERFAQLTEPLAKRGFGRAIVIGSPTELAQVHSLVSNAPTFITNLVGRTNIGQTMAVIAGADLVIANDSAPLHMAVGFDRPLVGLFGPTDPAANGPYQREECVVRGYHAAKSERINFKNPKLGDSLMRFISTAAVIQKIDDVMNRADHEKRERAKPQAAGASLAAERVAT